MKADSRTKEHLLSAAKEEFMEKGYLKASLRSICKKAEVTTGALYFFFQDKEDLFGNIVDAPLTKLRELALAHYEEEKQAAKSGVGLEDHDDDIEVALEVIDYLYQYRDEFLLVLLKSQGSKYENFQDEIISITEIHNQMLSNVVTDIRKTKPISKQVIHWMSHMQIEAFAYLLAHEPSKEAAKEELVNMIHFLISGWNGMYEGLEKQNNNNE
ncbi:transcriptional regulator, TetR family [Lachnospiraceae bacterium KM106-2]|nr:transcriptional regulator, TetR family [Lachnospiraceae bacterium KM106-2]